MSTPFKLLTKQYKLSTANNRDFVQLVLNSWMIYLSTGLQVKRALCVQCNRRFHATQMCYQRPHDDNKRVFSINANGVLEKSDNNYDWTKEHYVDQHFLIPQLSGRYVDQHFLIPDLNNLSSLLMLEYNGDAYDDKGMHKIFSQVLLSSYFAYMLRQAQHDPNTTDPAQSIELSLPIDSLRANSTQLFN